MKSSGRAFGVPKGKLRAIREMTQNKPGFRNRAIRATLAATTE
jgi:hypothetical protein